MEEINSPLPPRRIEVEEVEKEKVEKKEEVKEVILKPTEAKKKGMPKIPIWLIGVAAGVVVVGIILLLVLGKGKNKEKVVLNYWGIWEEESVMSGVIADFESKNPEIKINYVFNQKDNYRTRLKAKLNSGSEVDLFRIHANWLPMFEDNLAPVPDKTRDGLQLENDFFETYKESLKRGGKWLAIPLMYDGLVMYYNRDLVEGAGIEIPKAWWSLQEAASKLTKRDENGKITTAGVAMGLADNVDHWSDIVGLMMKQAMVDPLKSDKENQEILKNVLTYYTLFKTKVRSWDESLPPSTVYFAGGKLAFYFGTSWRMFEIEAMNPGLNYASAKVPQFPTIDTEKFEEATNEVNLTNIHWSSYWVEGVNKKSKNQKEVWKFLEYLASRDGLSRMYQTAIQIRSFGEIYPRKSLASEISTNVKLAPFVDSADQASSWYLTDRTFDNGLNDEMMAYFKDAINGITLKNRSAEDVMPDLRNGINQLVQRYGIRE